MSDKKYDKIQVGGEMIDTADNDEIMAILEEMEDQQEAVRLLRNLNDLSRELGTLIFNVDPNLKNSEWKSKCDQLRMKIDDLVIYIKSLDK
ncbi:MAG: hypothetical protein H6622_06280 [Halobacteriovoraceae bacterium]|nr:hypothetical protein [Halobacteriovoraceae bacterium]